MAKGSSRLPLVLLALLGVAVAFLCVSPARAQICGADIAKLIANCKAFVKVKGPKVNPSKACCAEVKKVDLPCLCKNIPPGVSDSISFDKAVFVARKCGKTVNKGTKCGNFTVPPLA